MLVNQWKVGTLSMGLLLIILGILLLGNTFWDISVTQIIIYGWPIILIILGVEVITYSFFKKEKPIKFDLFSIIILILALMFTFTIYTVQETGLLSLIRGSVNGQSYTLDINESLELSDSISEIIIDAPNGEFNITGNSSNSNTAKISGTIKIGAASKEEAEEYFNDVVTISISGNQAIIRIKQINKTNWFDGWTLESKLNISIPNNLYLKTNLINGDTYITDMSNSGNLEGTNGKIELRNTIGDFNINTVNGSIIASDNDGDIRARTVNGEINIYNASAELDLESVNGEIEVITSTVNGDWDMSSVNGDILISIPNNANAKIIGKTSFGDVEGDLQWIDKDKKDDFGSNKEARLNDGKHLIDLKTTHGDIEVDIR